MESTSRNSRPANRVYAPRGFTLVELLVVVTILLALTTAIVWGVKATRGTDRMAGAARVLQSSILGARDRAAHAGERRGVRLIRDTEDPAIVVGVEYVGPLPLLAYGGAPGASQVEIWRDAGGRAVLLVGIGPSIDWFDLQQRGYLARGSRVRIPAGGQWYTVTGVSRDAASGLQVITLGSEFGDVDSAGVVAVDRDSSKATSEIELGNERLAMTEPVAFPSGVVVDLGLSIVPGARLNDPAVPLDIVVTPRGTVAGPQTGPAYLVLCDRQDVGLNPLDARNRGERVVVRIVPQTGNVQSFPVDLQDDNSDGLADDLFRFARGVR